MLELRFRVDGWRFRALIARIPSRGQSTLQRKKWEARLELLQTAWSIIVICFQPLQWQTFWFLNISAAACEENKIRPLFLAIDLFDTDKAFRRCFRLYIIVIAHSWNVFETLIVFAFRGTYFFLFFFLDVAYLAPFIGGPQNRSSLTLNLNSTWRWGWTKSIDKRHSCRKVQKASWKKNNRCHAASLPLPVVSRNATTVWWA